MINASTGSSTFFCRSWKIERSESWTLSNSTYEVMEKLQFDYSYKNILTPSQNWSRNSKWWSKEWDWEHVSSNSQSTNQNHQRRTVWKNVELFTPDKRNGPIRKRAVWYGEINKIQRQPKPLLKDFAKQHHNFQEHSSR